MSSASTATITASKLIPQGRGLAAVLLRRATTVELDWDTRQKSRFEAHDSAGRRVAVFLPRGTVVRGGDVLVAEDGSLIRMQAAAQPVMVVRPCGEHGSPFDLLRAAYHLGNRHVQLELQADHLKLEPDHVLSSMLRSMHLIVTEQTGPFEPEGGAYAAAEAGHDPAHAEGHGHGHGHGHEHHDHDRGHAPGTDHGHAHADAPAPERGKPVGIGIQAASAPHVHGPGCGHDHGHHDH